MKRFVPQPPCEKWSNRSGLLTVLIVINVLIYGVGLTSCVIREAKLGEVDVRFHGDGSVVTNSLHLSATNAVTP